MSEELPARIQALISTINQAIAQVQGGEMINLDDLDREVAAVCDAASDPALENAAQIDEKMDMMIVKLEELSQALDEFEHTDEDEDEEE